MIRLLSFILCCAPVFGAQMILHNGRVVTLDKQNSVHQAIAVQDGRVLATGTNEAILKLRKPETNVIDLKGRMVLPGLIDPHVHALGGALSEYREKLPPLDSIASIQKWIVEKAKTTPKGEWIVVPRTLPPRLKEMRMPTRADLDVVKTHPVAFDGSYVWSANSMALEISGITKDTPNPPGGEVVKGPDGEPNGILRAASGLLKGVRAAKPFTEQERLDALEKMLQIYAEAGLTTIGDRAVGPADVALFEKLHQQKRLAVRTLLTWRINTNRPLDEVLKEIRENPWTTNQGDEWLKFSTFKVTLDGGQSVGTAYQRMPYGPFGRQLYGQTNPDARGTLFVQPDDLYAIFAEARKKGWQLTSHVQGGSAIDTLLDVFERLDKDSPIAPTRSHVMHGSFMSSEALERMKRMGIVADVQPHWLHLDVPALRRVFGLDNMRWFFPLRSMIEMGIPVAGGSDHMIGHDKDKAVNPFNPFYGMWMSITRRTTEGQVIYPEERVTREQALHMFTTGPAFMFFEEDMKGTIEKGKFADLTVIDRDYFTCPEDEIRRIQPVLTVVGGQIRHRKM
ncbi:MAG: amidohydrolase [Bryobacteraceae bacterium]|nr:amidohydrolase [Bryobacteraceae bacterium]